MKSVNVNRCYDSGIRYEARTVSIQRPRQVWAGPEPWCKEGQWVCIGRYSGSRFKIDGGEVRIINDDEVIATILEPDDIKQV